MLSVLALLYSTAVQPARQLVASVLYCLMRSPNTVPRRVRRLDLLRRSAGRRGGCMEVPGDQGAARCAIDRVAALNTDRTALLTP